MALIECHECKAKISSEAKTCPQCGAAPKKETSRLAIAIVGFIVIGMGMTLFNDSKDTSSTATASTPTPAGISKMQALALCQATFKGVAKDPEKAEIPYVEGLEDSQEFNFSWGASTRMMRMRNGLGLEVAASGSCAVGRIDRKIRSLTLDGKTLI